MFSARDGKKIRKTFARETEAKSWRADATAELARGGLRATKPITIRGAWKVWFGDAKAGTVTNRSGDPYKPSALRSYEQVMRLRVLPEFGAVRLSALRRPDVQDFADRMRADGLSPSSVKRTLLPLRAMMNLAVERGDLAVNPCHRVKLAAVRGRRERFVSAEEAEALLATAPKGDRAIWATALYAGLRRGELQALRVDDIDLANGVIRVERSWDEREGEIGTKSQAGRRRVPISAALRDYLAEYRVGHPEKTGTDLIFGRSASLAFDSRPFQVRADSAWKRAKLERVTLHECRHSYASLMIAAGVNAKALSTFMGHASVSITLDRYGHLMPGAEQEAAVLLDSYLSGERKRQEEAARAAGGALTGESTGERGRAEESETA